MSERSRRRGPPTPRAPSSALVESSIDADARPTPEGLEVLRFEVQGVPYALLSFPLRAEDAESSRLTRAEREVTLLLIEGKSNAEIGALRGTSLRTVANQVAGVFRKLGVSSRAELVGQSALLRGL